MGTLFSAIAAAALAILSSCDPQSIANLAWSFATLGRSHETLLQAISAESIKRGREYEPQEISNIVWSFARLTVKDRPLCSAIASAAIPKLSEFTSLNISNTAWAFGVLSETAHLDTFLPPATRPFVVLAQASIGTEWVDL